jgi:hypothetical protein
MEEIGVREVKTRASEIVRVDPTTYEVETRVDW